MSNPYEFIDCQDNKCKSQVYKGRRWLAPFLIIPAFGACFIAFLPHLIYWILDKDPPPYLCMFFDWCDRMVLGENDDIS